MYIEKIRFTSTCKNRACLVVYLVHLSSRDAEEEQGGVTKRSTGQSERRLPPYSFILANCETLSPTKLRCTFNVRNIIKYGICLELSRFVWLYSIQLIHIFINILYFFITN